MILHLHPQIQKSETTIYSYQLMLQRTGGSCFKGRENIEFILNKNNFQ